LPSPTFDPQLTTGLGTIPIEDRDSSEVLTVRGRVDGGRGDGNMVGKLSTATVSIYAEGTKAANPAFDVTPARLVSGYITEKGIFTQGTLATGIGTGLDDKPGTIHG
jgi:methylthioribose-1-phosphate isomerase